MALGTGGNNFNGSYQPGATQTGANPASATVQGNGHPNEAYIGSAPNPRNGEFRIFLHDVIIRSISRRLKRHFVGYSNSPKSYYHNQSHYHYQQSYYIQPQPALTATSGSQVTYQLQDPPTESMGEIKYTIDETDRRRGGKKSKKNRTGTEGELLENEVERVFIWDLDETIIIFHTLITGSHAQQFGKVNFLSIMFMF